MGFDPNIEPNTPEQADAYVNWCAQNCVRVLQIGEPTFRVAVRCAHWMLVTCMAPLHLHDEVTENREELLAQLGNYNALARALERQREHFKVERLIVLRSNIDCWEPVGRIATLLLHGARSAISSLILIELHPLYDLWELACPEVWDMLGGGAEAFAEWSEDFTRDDLSIRPDEMVLAKYTWQRAHNITRQAGLRVRLDPN